MTLTPPEAQIVLIALDVADAMGWDGSPSNILLESAKEKLEELAGSAPTLTLVKPTSIRAMTDSEDL